ncbi:MAG TPA: BON domain-containing protein [Stellaceae bacterium]|nr:BON domain-containing protein [Stellaceae bacterium]
MSRPPLAAAAVVAVLVAAAAAPLSGCLLAVGAGAAGGGYAVAAQERSLTDTARDAGLQAAITASWKKYNLKLNDDLDCTVYEGRALLTGTVTSDDWRAEAVKRAWQVDGIKEVYDEIQVGPDEGFVQDMGDTTITSKLKTQLIADGDVREINYSITTVKGVVYVIGTARSKQELDRVVDHARNIGNVKRVVSYVRIRSGEPAKPETASSAPPPAPATGSAPPASAAAAPTPPGTSDDSVSTPTPRQEIDVQPLK